MLEEKLLSLRKKLNEDIIKNIGNGSKEGYENLLSTSEELDEVIVRYIRSVNNKI